MLPKKLVYQGVVYAATPHKVAPWGASGVGIEPPGVGLPVHDHNEGHDEVLAHVKKNNIVASPDLPKEHKPATMALAHAAIDKHHPGLSARDHYNHAAAHFSHIQHNNRAAQEFDRAGNQGAAQHARAKVAMHTAFFNAHSDRALRSLPKVG